jgi:hypothetical protein
MFFRAIALVSLLIAVQVASNVLECVPSELANLQVLHVLHVRPSRSELPQDSPPCWPCSSMRIGSPGSQSSSTACRQRHTFLCGSYLLWCACLINAISQLEDNPLALTFRRGENARPRLLEVFSETTHIGMIRKRAATICFAMQDLELPAPLTLEIIDALLPNNIRMWAKWEIITTIKHFHHQRV